METRGSELILLIGIPASGKSTFYQRRFVSTHVHISLDVLRTRFQERAALDRCFAERLPIVVDNNNATREERSRYIGLANVRGYAVIGYYFASQISASLERNRERPTPLPDKAIFGQAGKLERPKRDEGFDALYYVSIGANEDFHIEEWNDAL